MKRKKQELIQELIKDDALCVFNCSLYINGSCSEKYNQTQCPFAELMALWLYDMGFRRSPKYMRKKYGGDEK